MLLKKLSKGLKICVKITLKHFPKPASQKYRTFERFYKVFQDRGSEQAYVELFFRGAKQ